MHQSIKFDQSLPSSSLRRAGPSRPSPPIPSRSPAARRACPSPSAPSWAATSIFRRTFSSGPARTVHAEYAEKLADALQARDILMSVR